MANARTIVAGTIGAVVGFVATVLAAELFEFGRNDPITTGMLVLFMFGPFGAAAGAWLGVALARRMSGAKKQPARPTLISRRPDT